MPRFEDEVIENKRIEAMRIANKKRHEENREKNREEKVCIVCGKSFVAYTKQQKRSKHCSQKCGRHTAGKSRKGKTYEEVYGDKADKIKMNLWKNRRIHPVGEIYPQKGSGYLLIKPAEHAHPVYYHIYMWEQVNGKKPRGYVIHHIDEDKSNNDISNLKMMTISEHAKLHNEIKRRIS